jgi:hypothetical protein
MFPERAIPDIDIDAARKAGKKNGEEDDDFLSRHGGKVALVGFGLAAWLIYRWFRNNSNRNEAESHMRMEYALSPSEISEMRHRNAISSEQYRGLIKAALSEFQSSSPVDPQPPASSSGSEGEGEGEGDMPYSGAAMVTYRDFIAFVKRYLCIEQLANGHHLDRAVLKYVEKIRKRSTSSSVSTSTTTTSGAMVSGDAEVEGLPSLPRPGDEEPLPLPFLLVALSMAVAARQAVRIGDMFYLCRQLDGDGDGGHGDVSNSRASDHSTTGSDGGTANSDVSSTGRSTSDGGNDDDKGAGGGCSRGAFLLTLQFLTDSFQVRYRSNTMIHPCMYLSNIRVLMYSVFA